MANRLQKLALTSYTPGRPYQPATPAYCVYTEVYLPAATVIDRWETAVQDGVTYYIPVFKTRPAGFYTEEVCYPAQPAVSGIPATVQYTTINGWNSGARSIVRMPEDGVFSFRVKANPAGVVVGITASNESTLPSEQTHAFYVHGDTVELMELGVVVDTVGIPHSSANLYAIKRSGGTVSYGVDGSWFAVSALPSSGEVMLDASLYSTGDFVQDPTLESISAGGYAAGSLPSMVGIADADGVYAAVSGAFGALTGDGTGYTPNVGYGTLGALTGYSADRPYAGVTGAFLPLLGTGDGGFPQVEIASGQGSFSPLAGNSFGVTGEIGGADGSFAALSGQAADRPYGAAYGTLGALDGWASPRIESPGRRRIVAPLLIGSRFATDYPRRAKISSTLVLESSVLGQVQQRNSISSLLLLGSSVTGTYDSAAGITSRLLIGGRVRGSGRDYGLDGEISGEALQYAVNPSTTAVSQYTGLDFLQFAHVDGYLYGVRADGLYLIGEEPEEGIQFRADLGAGTLGTPRTKYVTDLYLGGETDGKLIALAYTDGDRRDYRVHQRGPQMRSKWAKGVNGRTWGLTIEGAAATYFELDSIELVTQQANRIWVGGRHGQ